MGAFIVRRLLLSLLALVGVLVVTFVIVHLAPIDPARQYAGPNAPPQRVEEVRHQLGLDRSLPVQIVTYAKNFFSGDWGTALIAKRPVTDMVKQSLPYTIELVFFALLLEIVVGIPLGVLSASHKDKWPDHMSRTVSVALIAIPTFWLALGLQYVLAGNLHLLPLSGAGSYSVLILHPIQSVTGIPLIDAALTGNWTAFWDHLAHIAMPVMALSFMMMGGIQRLTRASFVETLQEDFVVAARSYGLPERDVLWRHGLKNSVGVLATIIAMTTAWLLVNTFVVESIFAWPGIGSLIVDAIARLDYPVVLAVTLMSAVAYLALNTLADIIVATDPRTRL